MSVKKTLFVNFTRLGHERWTLTLQSKDPDLLTDIRDMLRASTKKHDVVILNAADPFGGVTVEAQENKKPRKPRADKGTKRGSTASGESKTGN